MKNPTTTGSLCSFCALVSSTSYNELFTSSSFLNSLLLMAECVFFVSEVVRYSVSAPVHDLVTIGALGKNLLRFFDNT